jgi:transcriptional regulator with XRE-family HTH domain
MELAAQLQLLGIIIDRSGIAKLESGRRPASDIEIAAIAKILKVPISWLFEDSGERPASELLIQIRARNKLQVLVSGDLSGVG